MGLSERLGIRHHVPKEAPTPPPQAGVWREGYVDLLAKDVPQGEIKGAILGIDGDLAEALGMAEPGTVATPTSAMNAYRKSTAVSVPVNLVAEQMAKMSPVLQNVETMEQDSKHESLDLLRRPHPLFPRDRFFETVAKYYLIANELPIVGLGSRSKPPIMLQPVNPKYLSPVQDSSMGFAKSWNITGPALRGNYSAPPRLMGREYQDGSDRRLRMIVGFSTKDDGLLRGESKLVAAGKEVWQQIEGANYNLQLLRQGGRPSLVFHFKGTMDRDTFLETKALILSQVEGAQNAGRVLVTRGNELDIHEGANNNREMEYQEGQKTVRQILFQVFKVPIILGSLDASTFNNYGTAQLALWDDAVIPLFSTIFGSLGEWLLPMYGVDPNEWRFWFDESQIQVLADRALERRIKRVESGVEKVNEIRRDIPGADPVDGGDEILVSGTQVPLSVAAAPVEVELPGPGGDPPPPADPDDPDDSVPDPDDEG